MLPRTLIPTVLGLAALAAGAVAPGAAEAAKPKPMTKHTYKVSLKGVQKTSWTLDHPDGGRCDSAMTGAGKEVVKFRSKTVRMHAYEGLQIPTFFNRGGTGELVLALRGTVDRTGATTIAPADPDEACADGEGGAPPVPDCGTKAFKGLKVSPSYEYGTDEIVLEPDTDLLTSPSFEHCPHIGPAEFPQLLEEDGAGRTIGQELPLKDLFGHGKNIIIATGTHKQTEGESRWTSKIRWELSFTRVKKEELGG